MGLLILPVAEAAQKKKIQFITSILHEISAVQQFRILISAKLNKSTEQLEKLSQFTYIIEETKYNLIWS